VCQIILLRFRKQACSCQAHAEGSFQFTVISGKGWHTHWYVILTNNSAFKQYFLMTFQTFLWFISHSHRTKKKKGCLHVTRATLILAGCVGISDHLCWDIPYMFINMFHILYIYIWYICVCFVYIYIYKWYIIYYKIIYIYICIPVSAAWNMFSVICSILHGLGDWERFILADEVLDRSTGGSNQRYGWHPMPIKSHYCWLYRFHYHPSIVGFHCHQLSQR